ncbi:MAG: MBL fold metallo-hydrolase [Lachnospiraceae bacterium]|nr:MBL fold metallo-hydrolase [Lachnospiraceae bacterium]
MKITHLYHSGFSVELEQSVLIFDWYQGMLPLFDPEKEIYVFVSHKHPDHYSTKIWELASLYPKIHFILHRGICKQPPAETVFVTAHREYAVGSLQFHTLLSTDTGVAYLVQVEGKTIYHAGDLNLWYWEGESETENKWQIGTYQAEINRLKNTPIDVAFLTLDPRQKKNAVLGMQYFLKQITVLLAIPMHYWDEKEKAKAYLETEALLPYRSKICFDDEIER